MRENSKYNLKARNRNRQLYILLLILIIIVILTNIPILSAFESTVALPVDLNVNARFSMDLTPNFSSSGAQAASAESVVFGFQPSNDIINFGTYTGDNPLPSQSVEIYCSSNTGASWQIDIAGEALSSEASGTVLNESPIFWSWAPTPASPGDFQKAEGTCMNGSFPTSGVLYQSAPGETGSGILIILGLNANIAGLPEAGDYRTQITLTMHE